MSFISWLTGLFKPYSQRTYTVQSGDTLSHIARHYYGESSSYMLIFNANRDQLSDPNQIKPGQVLIIPPKP